MGNATPLADSLWIGISGHFDSLSQVLSEFLDNSISNIMSKKPIIRSIIITIKAVDEGYHIAIEDSGTGIDDFDSVLKLGDLSNKQSPLNEHGFGLKHALATANPENDKWSICTRTAKDYENNCFRKVTSNYRFDYIEQTIDSSNIPWPGQINTTGTIIEFTCSESLFNTLQKGISGNAGYKQCLEYLLQDLGYVYAGILEKGLVNISLLSPDIDFNEAIVAVKPTWVDFYQNPKPGKIKMDIGSGEVEVEYTFGEMSDSGNPRYYKRNQSSSGIELRINGRVLMSNLFKEIWHIEPHPSYNHFLGIINIMSNDPTRLPKTRTSKNGIRTDDIKLQNLYRWIKNVYPKPEQKLTNAISERLLVEQLAELKIRQTRSPAKHIETEFPVFTTIQSPVAVDLYYFDGYDVVIYEAKKGVANVQNFYQLLMYWDGLVSDETQPTEGILIASDFSPGVAGILSYFNEKLDANGNQYNFSLKTWKEEGIDFPQ